MKRLINCLLFFTFFYTFNIIHASENIIVETKILSSPWSSSEFFIKSYYPQEGFCGNTLIQTPFGYKIIRELAQDDIIIDCNGEEKKIIAITKQYVNRYIKFIVDNTPIYTGCDQLYYSFLQGSWVAAQDIKVGDILLNNANESCLVTYAELIHENKLLYYLTVEDHTFCMASCGLYAHNAEAFMVGASSMCLSHIVTINPIVATIGATVASSAIAYKAYQAYIQQYPGNDETIALPTEVTLAERSYYAQRLTALETIKQELLCIKNGLENIKAFCGANSASFTYQFLKQTNIQNAYNQNQLLKISTASEMQLSDKQKENLKGLREIVLENLEQEIVALQVALAFHINELIEQVYEADNEYKKAKKEIDAVTDLWNNNCNQMTDSIALQSYKADLLDEHLLNNFNQKVDELKIVIHYYRNCMNVMCIRQSTNIIDLLEKMNPAIAEYDKRIAKEKARIAQKFFVSEQYFVRRGIYIEHVKNETKNYLEKGRKGRNVQAITEAKNKLASIAVSGGPNKNNKKNDDDKDCDDNDEQPFGKYEDAPYHHKNSTGVKSVSPDNGQDVLNHSIASPNQNSKRRYGVSQSGQYVVFDETSPRLYHGHVVEWSELSKVKGLQKELIMQGMASKFGKAIYKIAKKITKKVIP